jgi:hypothetical protein
MIEHYDRKNVLEYFSNHKYLTVSEYHRALDVLLQMCNDGVLRIAKLERDKRTHELLLVLEECTK